MYVYVLYALLMAAIVIAVIAATPQIPERIRRWLVVALSLLVLVPAVIFLLFGAR